MLKIIILGIIQGISEFLPISSSGHLVIFGEYLNVSVPGNTMEVMLHIGTVFSILVCFWPKVWLIIQDFFGIFTKRNKNHFNTKTNPVLLLIIASIPAVITGLLLDNYFEQLFDSVFHVGIALIVTGLVLFYSTKVKLGNRELKDLTAKDALFIGIAQSLAVIPGISRSGMSITAGFKKKLSRKTAAEWSFLMSLPVTAGAGLLKIPAMFNDSNIVVSELIVGIIASFIFGIIAIKVLMKVIQSDKWKYFSYYCLIMGVLMVALNI
jgi:undecaprenyl-diphosphatase